MAFDRTRTLRGALAGSVGAAVWLAQQPLDRRAFGYDHDDAELLGRLVARGRPEAPALGALLHVQNGALFGALYANFAPSLPVPPILRGPLLGLLEHLATWPAVALVDPPLWRSGRAFSQSAWRHLLFGLVVGELERRLNPPSAELEPVSQAAVASNGHGSAEHLVGTG
jgi:xanthosine utilization system XapX-like protein